MAVDDPLSKATARRVILQFLLQCSKTLESIQLHAHVIAKDDIAAPLLSTHSSRTIFPHLTSISLCPEDYIAELIDAPNLCRLEIGHPVQGIAQHLDYSPFCTAETLVIASTGHVGALGLCAALKNMRNIHHLQIRVDPDLIPSPEFRFLCWLSMPFPPFIIAEAFEHWLFPDLRSIDLHFALWPESSPLEDPGLLPVEGSDADPDFVPDESSSDTSDPAEYYSHSSRWSSSSDDLVNPNDAAEDNGGNDDDVSEPKEVIPQSISTDADYGGENFLGGHSHSPPESTPGSRADGENSDMNSVSDDALEYAQRPWPPTENSMPIGLDVRIRGAYGYLLRALQDIVTARREASQVSTLESVEISTGQRVQDDFVPPEEIRLWFEANVTTFKAPREI